MTDFGTRTSAGLTLSAISDGEAISKLRIARVEETSCEVTPTFTAGDAGSSRFHVHVFKDGALQGGQEGINPNTTIPIVGIVGSGDDDRDGGDRRKFKAVSTHKRGTNSWEAPGACQWSHETLDQNATFLVRLPNGRTLTGDEVLFTEAVAEGHAVYNEFQRIDMTGDLDSHTILDASTIAAD